jgi:hypothetical protein
MFSLVLSRLMGGAGGLLQALSDLFYGFFSAVQEAHAHAARFEQLARLSDAELARRGLRREGLAQAVFTAVEA